MSQLRYINFTAIAVFFGACQTTYAESQQSLSTEKQEIVTDQKLVNKKLTIAQISQLPKDQLISYLKTDVKIFEQLLGYHLVQKNAQELKILIPEYQTIENHDPSVVDWGQAIITARFDTLKKAIRQYKNLYTKLPNNKIIQKQLATLLFYNKQYNASKREFVSLKEKLLVNKKLTKKEVFEIDQFIDSIDSKQKINLSFNASVLIDDNISNLAAKGTKIPKENGSSWEQTQDLETGKGINYDLYANKKFLDDDGYYLDTDFNLYGKLFFNNKKYNDVNIRFSETFGYERNENNISVSPYYKKYLYAGGGNYKSGLIDFSDTIGVTLQVSTQLNQKLNYQFSTGINKTAHTKKYRSNDSTDITLNNNFIFPVTSSIYGMFGYNYANKNLPEDKGDSWRKHAISLGLGVSLPYNFSNKTSFSFAKKNYKDSENFIGVKRKNNEFSLGSKIWNKKISFYGLTPKVGYSYNQVTSNSILEERKDHDFTFELSKYF